ncbi:MAG: hypothetical protein ACXIVF_15405 [Rhizobiaceae bacterium]
MSVTIKHKFRSDKADGTDPKVVRPSDWNAEHEIVLPANSVLGRATGVGPAQTFTMTAFGRALLATTSTAQAVVALGFDDYAGAAAESAESASTSEGIATEAAGVATQKASIAVGAAATAVEAAQELTGIQALLIQIAADYADLSEKFTALHGFE